MLLVGGENLIDFIQVEGDDDKPVYQGNPGGSPYNVAKAMARQQVPVSYLTPVSTDSLGELLATGLTDSGVNLCGERRPEPSSMAVVSLENGIASYQFYRQNTAERMVTSSGLDANVPAGAEAFHLGSLAIANGADADIWTDFYVAQYRRGVFTSLDPNIREAFILDRPTYMERLDRLLAATDLLKLSDEDLDWLSPGVDAKVAAGELFARSNAKLLVLTLGGEGAIAFFGDKTLTVDAANANPMKDTVGAGDTFMATMLARLKQNGQLNAAALAVLTVDDVRSLLERAAVAAALNCEKTGCEPPVLSEIDARLMKA